MEGTRQCPSNTVIFGYRVRPAALRTLDIHQEVARLQQLSTAGIAVPEVYVHTNDFFIMQACGLSLNDLLKQQAEVLSVEEKRKYLRAAVEALIDLHQKKQWHGGAQLRNVTWWKGVVYRIDFEENTGNALPLSIAQAYDVMQCFLTLAPHLKDDRAYGHELFALYLEHHHNPDIVTELRKTARALHRLTRLRRFLSQKTLQSSDVQATLFFYELLQQGLKTP